MKERDLQKLIEKSKNILITSHARPDQDAIACTYFVKKILERNYPTKRIRATIESINISQWSSLFETDQISDNSLIPYAKKFRPDLLIVTDCSDPLLLGTDVTKENFIKCFVNTSVVFIDHHSTKINLDFVRLLFNDQDNSCAETVYKVFIKKLKLKPYNSYYNHLLFGIVADTGAFSYIKSDPKNTFLLVSELINLGGSIDYIKTISERLTLNQLTIEKEFLNNLTTTKEYTYSYISDKFYLNNKHITQADFTTANKHFVQIFLKTIESALWGFTVKPVSDKKYSISFRAPIGYIDLTCITKYLNGGGHKSASGGEISANSIDEALKKIKRVINKHKREAYKNK